MNANKVVTSLAATGVVRRGIETLGGNGTIEDFSPLPRLWRDAIVFESWEGTHNVLCAQVLRDLSRLGWLRLAVERAGAAEELSARLRRSVDEPAFGGAALPTAADGAGAVVHAAVLRRLGWDAEAELIERRHRRPGGTPSGIRGTASWWTR